jgi:hypothetical protein
MMRAASIWGETGYSIKAALTNIVYVELFLRNDAKAVCRSSWPGFQLKIKLLLD